MKLLKHLLFEMSNSNAVLDDMVEDGAIQSYQINADGSVDINGDLIIQGRFEDLGLPKVNFVDGSFEWYFLPENYDPFPHLPKSVRGDCTVPGNGFTVRSSMLPRSTSGVGVLHLAGSKCKIVLENDAPFTFEEFILGNDSCIVSGLEHMPRDFDKMDHIDIEVGDISGMPPRIKCKSFTLVVSTPAALKGFNRHVKSIVAEDSIIVKFPERSPILGVLQAVKGGTFFPVVDSWSRNGPENQSIRRVVNTILKSEPAMDMFEMQEALIDAGFGQFAKA